MWKSPIHKIEKKLKRLRWKMGPCRLTEPPLAPPRAPLGEARVEPWGLWNAI